MEWNIYQLCFNGTKKEGVMSIRAIYRDIDFEAKMQLSDVLFNGSIHNELTDADLHYYCAVPPVCDATLERNIWRLDGNYDVVDMDKNPNTAYFGSSLSSESGNNGRYMLNDSPTITYKFKSAYSVNDITFSFFEESFCNEVLIRGFVGETEVFSFTIFPDNAFYNCTLGEIYEVDSLVFTFKSLNKPGRFFRLYGIDLGKAHIFTEDEVYSLSILTETSLINKQMFIGTSDLMLDIRKHRDVNFTKYKPIYIYRGKKIEQTHFLSNFDEAGANQISLSGADTIYMLNEFGEAFPKILKSDTFLQKNNTENHSSILTNYGLKLRGNYNGGNLDELKEANIPNYEGPYEFDITLADMLSKYKQYSKTKVYASKDNTDSLSMANYTGETFKVFFELFMFATQGRVIIQPNGFIRLDNKDNEIKTIASNRIYDNQRKVIENRVTNIDYKIYDYSLIYHTERRNGDAYDVDEDARIYTILYSETPIWFLGASVWNQDSSSTPIITPYANHSVELEFYGARYGVKCDTQLKGRRASGEYKYATLKTDTEEKSTELIKVNSNGRQVPVSVGDNKYLTKDKEENFINSLINHYEHNTSIEFDMIIDDEIVGDMIRLEFPTKVYTGAIEKMEYTMQGKKIGTVKMRIYKEENVNG
jgi:hypothetical protein